MQPLRGGAVAQCTKKIEYGRLEEIIAIARNHVTGPRNIHKSCVRRDFEKFLGMLLLNELRLSSSNQRGGNGQRAGGLHAMLFRGELTGFDGMRPGDEGRIPMPAIATVLSPPQVLGKARQRFGTISIRQIGADRLSGLFQRGKSFVGSLPHETQDPVDAVTPHPGRDVDENQSREKILAGQLLCYQRRNAAKRRAHRHGLFPVLLPDLTEQAEGVSGKVIEIVVCAVDPVTVAMTPQIDRDCSPAVASDTSCSRLPGMAGLTAAMHENHGRPFCPEDSRDQRILMCSGKRADLLDRLAFDVVNLPPLRFRQEDIPELAEYFASGMCRELERAYFPGFSEQAMAKLLSYHWPGNIRELKNVVERSVYRSDAAEEVVADVVLDPFQAAWQDKSKSHAQADEGVKEAFAPADIACDLAVELPADLPERMRELEKQILEQALSQNRFNQRQTADSLGLSYHQLRSYLRKHQMLPLKRYLAEQDNY